MKVLLDRKKCQGHGQCLLFAAELFVLDDEGIAVLLNEHPDDSQRTNVLDSIRACPVRAIRMEED